MFLPRIKISAEIFMQKTSNGVKVKTFWACSNMVKSEAPRFEGEVIEALPSANFRVRLDDGREVLSHLSGKMRIHHIKIMMGDRVVMELSSYNDKRGRIVYRK